MLIFNWLAALFFLVLFSTTVYGYSFFIKKHLKYFTDFSLVLALGLYLNLILIIGLLPHGYTWPLQLPPIILGLYYFFKASRKTKISSPTFNAESVWLIFPVLYFVTRFFSAGILQQHGDSLYYHLAAPKLWIELGQIQLTAEHPSYAQAGIFEGIYGLPLLFLEKINLSKGLFAKATTQIFAQWMHLFWGHILSIYIAKKILEKITSNTKLSNKYLFFSWLAVTLPSVEWLSCLAKNDYVMTAFALASVYELHRKNIRAGAIYAGLCYATKTLGIMLVLTAPVIVLIQLYQDRKFNLKNILKNAAIYSGIVLLTTAPFFLRNLIWCKNPLFPYADTTWGPGWLSDGWNKHLHASGGSMHFDSKMLYWWLQNQLFSKALPKIIIFLGFVSVAIKFYKSKKIYQSTLALFLISATALCLTLIHPYADGRYGMYTGVLIIIYFLGAIINTLTTYKKFQKQIIYGFLILGFFINIPLDSVPKIIKNYLFQSQEKYISDFHWTHGARKWLNANAEESKPILFHAEKMNYYLELPFETMSEMKHWENVFSNAENAKSLFKTLKDEGYRYFHISLESGCGNCKLGVWDDVLKYRNKAVFTSSTALVYDLNRLEVF